MAPDASAETAPLRIMIGFAEDNYTPEDGLSLVQAFERHGFVASAGGILRFSAAPDLAGLILLHLPQWTLNILATKLLQQAYGSWLRDPLQRTLFSAKNKEKPPTLQIDLEDSRVYITSSTPANLDESVALLADMAEVLKKHRLEGSGTRLHLIVQSKNGEGHATPDGGDTLYRYYPETKSFIRTSADSDA